MELLPYLVSAFNLGQLLDAMNEEFKFLKYLSENLNVLVVDRLMQQVIEAEPTRNYQHQALV